MVYEYFFHEAELSVNCCISMNSFWKAILRISVVSRIDYSRSTSSLSRRRACPESMRFLKFPIGQVKNERQKYQCPRSMLVVKTSTVTKQIILIVFPRTHDWRWNNGTTLSRRRDSLELLRFLKKSCEMNKFWAGHMSVRHRCRL